VESSDDALAQLLREFLLEDRIQRRTNEEANINNSNKKKRKKKKKKKATTATGATDNHSTKPDSPAAEQSPADSTPLDSTPVPVPVTNTTVTMSTPRANEDPKVRQKMEQKHRIQVLLDRFLDSRIIHTQQQVDHASETGVDLQQLHSFIQTITDSGFDTTQHPLFSCSMGDVTLLPLAQIQVEVEALECPACRRDVQRLLLSSQRQIQYQEPLRLTGIRVPTVCDVYRQQEELEAETAQYQLLMEEGTKPPEHDETWTFDRVYQNKAQELEGWRLQRPLASRAVLESSTANSTTTAEGNWSMRDLEFLLQEYVVLQGLDPDTIMGATLTLEPDVLISLTESVDSKSKITLEEFSNMALRLANSVEKFYSIKSSNSNVDWKSFGIMKETDEECDVILHELLRICCDVTRLVHFVLTNASGGVDVAVEDSGATPSDEYRKPFSREDALSETHWATAQCIELWRSYLGTVDKIFRQMDSYQEHLFALNGDLQAKLPEMFVNAEARSLFSSFVQAKVVLCHSLIETIEKRLQHPTDIGGWTSQWDTSKQTTFHRRVLMEEAYYRFLAGKEKRRHPRRQKLDESCEDVLTTIRECTASVHGPTVARCLNEHHVCDEKLTRLLQNVGKHLDDSINKIFDGESGAPGDESLMALS